MMRGELQEMRAAQEIIRPCLPAYPIYAGKRKILIPLPPSGTLARKKQLLLIRIAIALFVIIFIIVQLNVGKCSAYPFVAIMLTYSANEPFRFPTAQH